MARGLLKPALVTPGGHRRFLPKDVEGLESRLAPSELIGSSEAARLLGISQHTLNRAVRNGNVRPAVVTPGGHRRFTSSAIVESGREAANGAAHAQGAVSSRKTS